jgi:hypothetical protein
MTALIMLGATVAYFAITIPLAMWIGRAIKRGQRK